MKTYLVTGAAGFIGKGVPSFFLILCRGRLRC